MLTSIGFAIVDHRGDAVSGFNDTSVKVQIQTREEVPPLIPPQMNEICIWLKRCQKVVKA
jgi:hypothetical protein